MANVKLTDFEKKIYDVIASYNGIYGRDIALNLGIEKQIVNSTLYKSEALKLLVRQDNYKWYTLEKITSNSNSGINSSKADEDLKKSSITI